MNDKYIERARQLRGNPARHCNCAQAVLETFAAECGLSGEQAHNLGAHFGNGMKMGSTCGAITGGLMVIGLMGGGEPCRKEFIDSMKRDHENMTDCRDLLRKNAETGVPKGQHCDELVYEAVKKVADILGL